MNNSSRDTFLKQIYVIPEMHFWKVEELYFFKKNSIMGNGKVEKEV